MIELDTIYCEDCLEGMKRIPDKSVDMVLGDCIAKSMRKIRKEKEDEND